MGDPRMRAAVRPDRSPSSASETAESLYKTPALVSHHVRCGKPSCRCASGDLHGPYFYRFWRAGGTLVKTYVPRPDVEQVRRSWLNLGCQHLRVVDLKALEAVPVVGVDENA